METGTWKIEIGPGAHEAGGRLIGLLYDMMGEGGNLGSSQFCHNR